MNLIKQIIEGHWDEISGKIQSHWGKLTNDHLAEINGSYKELRGQLRKLYGFSAAELGQELMTFFESSDFDKIKRKFKEKFDDIKSVVVDTVDEYLNAAKSKTVATEAAVMEYITANPLKSAGIAVATGFILGLLLKGNRD